jgi:4-amino-4-deoxy-L-arabinose transferase-like glycosyltransferase
MPLSRFFFERLSPAQQAALLLLFHVTLWTALPLLATRNLPLDVVEALAWGREWQWGYYKHPPLSGWLAELARTGPHDWSLFLLAQIMVGSAMAASWLLGRDLVGARLATCGLMALEGIHYFNASSTEFNANVVMFPFWAWATLSFWRALRSQGQRQSTAWWLAAGLFSGLGTLGKYVFLLLPASVFIYSLAHRQARQHWRTPGPWLAMAVFTAVIGPHLRWAMQHDWATLQYAVGRGHADELAQQGSWLQEFINFTLAQALTLLPMWSLLRLLGPAAPTMHPSADRWLLLTLGLAPLLMIMLAAALAQAKMLHMWASPFFLCAAPLWLAWRTPPQLNVGRFVKGWWVWVTLMAALYTCTNLLGPQFKHRLDRTSYPGREIADALTSQWRAQTGRPLGIVAGEEFVAGVVAQYSSDRPSVFYDADFHESLWLTPDEVARKGAVFVWPIGRGETDAPPPPVDSSAQVRPLLGRYPTLQVKPTLLVRTSWLGKPYTVAVAWAVLAPEPLQNFSER